MGFHDPSWNISVSSLVIPAALAFEALFREAVTQRKGDKNHATGTAVDVDNDDRPLYLAYFWFFISYLFRALPLTSVNRRSQTPHNLALGQEKPCHTYSVLK